MEKPSVTSSSFSEKIKNFFTYEIIDASKSERIRKVAVGRIIFIGALVAACLLGMAATGTLVGTGVFGLWGSVIWTFLGISTLSNALKVLIVILSVAASGALIGGLDLAAFFIFFSVVTKIEKKKEEKKKNKEFDPSEEFDIKLKVGVKNWNEWCAEDSTAKCGDMHYNKDAGFKGGEYCDFVSKNIFFSFRFIEFLGFDYEYFLIASGPLTNEDNNFSILIQEESHYNIVVFNLDDVGNLEKNENFFPESEEEKIIKYGKNSELKLKFSKVLAKDNDKFTNTKYSFKNFCPENVSCRKPQYYQDLYYLKAKENYLKNVKPEGLKDVVDYLDGMSGKGRIIVCSSEEINKTSLMIIALMIKNYIKKGKIKKGISNSDLKKEIVKAIAIYAKERFHNKYHLYKDALLEENRFKLLFDFAKLCLN